MGKQKSTLLFQIFQVREGFGEQGLLQASGVPAQEARRARWKRRSQGQTRVGRKQVRLTALDSVLPEHQGLRHRQIRLKNSEQQCLRDTQSSGALLHVSERWRVMQGSHPLGSALDHVLLSPQVRPRDHPGVRRAARASALPEPRGARLRLRGAALQDPGQGQGRSAQHRARRRQRRLRPSPPSSWSCSGIHIWTSCCTKSLCSYCVLKQSRKSTLRRGVHLFHKSTRAIVCERSTFAQNSCKTGNSHCC